MRVLTSSSPLLLGRALAPRLCDIEVLEPVLLGLVDDLVLGIQAAQLADGSYARRVVRGDGGALEALVKDARAQAQPLGVVCRAEDAALDLRGLEESRHVTCRSPNETEPTLIRSSTRCRGTAMVDAMRGGEA